MLTRSMVVASIVLVGHATVTPLGAQWQGVDLLYGRWYGDSATSLYSAAYVRPVLGPVSYGLGMIHIDDRLSPLNRTQTGAELTVAVGRSAGSGPYSIGSVSLAMRHDDGSLDAHWSAGLGYALRVLPVVSLGVEAAYRVEDSRARGFWRLDGSDRRGVLLQGRLALSLGSRRPTRPDLGPRRGGSLGGSAGVIAPAGRRLSVRDAETATARIVETALDAMGAPYRWGGTDENGYDCSGLIQFAYEAAGVQVPRISRDQVRLGTSVDLEVHALAPGDILGFALEGTYISHVALYVGRGDFIHSTSTGVRTSSLSADDPDSRWWQSRWVSARRLLE